MSIEALIRVLPPPAEPTHATGRPWEEIEAAIGLNLPSDYKAYVARYGLGSINGMVIPLNPHTPNRHVDLERKSAVILDALRTTRSEFPAEMPYPLFPEDGGLFPWALTDNGDYCFWLTTPAGDPNAWRVVLDEVRGNGFLEVDESMTSLLAKALGGELGLDRVFTEDVVAGGPTFEPYE